MRLVDFGQAMRQYRKTHKLTWEKLAERLGAQKKHISLLENSHRIPGSELPKKLENMIIANELSSALAAQDKSLSEEELYIQLQRFHKLSQLNSFQRETVLKII